MLKFARRFRHAIARATLWGFVAFWALAAGTPCVMAEPCAMHAADAAPHCSHANKAMQTTHSCVHATQADCQKADQNLSFDQQTSPNPGVPPAVLLHISAPPFQLASTTSRAHQSNNASRVPRPPLNLQHARLLI
jgi:hypothetical protein